jgi:hypothetical protein
VWVTCNQIDFSTRVGGYPRLDGHGASDYLGDNAYGLIWMLATLADSHQQVHALLAEAVRCRSAFGTKRRGKASMQVLSKG